MKYSMRAASVLLAVFSTPLALAQSGNSTISGSVKDASEAAVASARVKITNVDTGVRAASSLAALAPGVVMI
jgi:hypothetical protein